MSADSTVTTRSAIAWFEIPVKNFDRARKFYESIFETTLMERPFGAGRIAVFPYERPGVGGCLDESSVSTPSASGTVIYLDASGRLDRTLELTPKAGGSVEMPKNALPGEMGSIAQIIDSEGNRVGLHAIS